MALLPLKFARRYLFSRKSHSVINIISLVSALTVAVPVMALVVLLSVFNGLEALLQSLYRNFDPDITVSLAEGKRFDVDSLSYGRLMAVEGVGQVSYVLDENALLQYRSRQSVATMRGVDSNYTAVMPVDRAVVRGEYKLLHGERPQMVMGQGVAYALGVNLQLASPVEVYIPTVGRTSIFLPVGNYSREVAFPSGIFALDAETDSKYVIVSLDFAQEATGGKGKATSVGIKVDKGHSLNTVREKVQKEAGAAFTAKTRTEQRATVYRIMKYEKWGIYLIIVLVMVIASFSLVGSLVMMMIEKRKDTETLATMGAERRFLRRIFVAEGMLISGVGLALGLVLGVVLALLQQKYGFVQLGGTSFLIDAYPVELRPGDIAMVAVTVAAINYAISYFTVKNTLR